MIFLNIKTIQKKITNRIPGPTRIQSYYSVLIPIIEIDDKLNLIYELRASNLSTQPGQISFPGGKVERGEEFSQAAVRECAEELLIEQEKIKLLGEIDYLITPFDFIIYAFIGCLKLNSLSEIKTNNEVAEVFNVPLEYFLDHEPEKYGAYFKSEFDTDFPYHLLPEGKNHKKLRSEYYIYFYRYQNRVIWGITAELTKNFIDILKNK